MTPRQLYERLRYEMQPISVTTSGPCSQDGCIESARGSGMCASCAAAKLTDAGFPGVELLAALAKSRRMILLVEERLSGKEGGES